MTEPRELGDVRRELQRLGYLSHRVERFLLQDALVPRDPWHGVPRLAAKIGLLGGSLLAAANAFALAAANGALESSPFDLLPLFLHLLPPLVLGSALGFVALVALFVGARTAFPRRSLDLLRVGAALAATALLVGAGVLLGWDFLVALPRTGRAIAAAAVPLVAAAVARLLADGLLAFGIRWTRRAPGERRLSRRAVTLAVAGSVAGLAALALFLPRTEAAVPPPSLPTAPGVRVALVGVDGVLADEFDYLLARGDLPALAGMARRGGVVAAYRRDPAASPAEFWTTVATGLPPRRHGVVSLDSFRPLGVATPLARTGPWRLWLGGVERPLGLAEHRPLLAGRRRVPCVWELAARGGQPVAALDWWATYPAEPLPGLVLAHGGFGLLAEGVEGAVAPESRRAELARRAAATGPGPFESLVDAALPAPERRAALDKAILPDRFVRALARDELAAGVRALAVYLPALDLLAQEPGVGRQAFAELVHEQLVETDALVAELEKEDGAVVVVFDPGRRGGEQGRALIWNGGCAAETRPVVTPEAIAPALLRALGLPQSAELPDPPDFCAWPPPPGRVATYGERPSSTAGRAAAGAYLESLRSLGYL
jgi:hypothetical protein